MDEDDVLTPQQIRKKLFDRFPGAMAERCKKLNIKLSESTIRNTRAWYSPKKCKQMKLSTRVAFTQYFKYTEELI